MVSVLRIRAVSVTSMVSVAGSSPLRSRASRTSSTMTSWSSWRPETFTESFEGASPRMPGRHLPAGLDQHPAPDLEDLTARFEQRDELVGLDECPGSGGPSATGLRLRRARGRPGCRWAGRRGGTGRHSSARPQIELELVALADMCVHLRAEHLVAVLARGFGQIQRHVRVPKQLAGRAAVANGDADAGGDRQRQRRHSSSKG